MLVTPVPYCTCLLAPIGLSRYLIRLVLLAGTNFSDLKGSWMWRVLTLVILSLATRIHEVWLKESFQMQLSADTKFSICHRIAKISTRL